MATFKWFDGNQGVYGYQDFHRYDVTKITSKAMIGEYNGDRGPLEETEYPATFKVFFRDGVVLNPGADPDDVRFSEGTIHRIAWFNSNGDKIQEITGLDVDLSVFTAMRADNEDSNFFRWILNGGNTYIGSEDSSTTADGWDGDDITTGSGNDTVMGNGGGDYISDRGGADTYDGGEGGGDTLSYDAAFHKPHLALQGIRADLKAGTVVGTDGLTDQVTGIENIRGSFMRDIIRGDDGNNRLTGLQGNDVLNGRGGFDTVRYDRDDRNGGLEGVWVNLGKGKAIDGFGNKDTLKNIEAVRGSMFDDVLKDSSGDNFLSGRDGDDRICVDNGDDHVEGGAGADLFQFKSRSFGDNVIYDFEDGTDMIEILHAKRFRQLDIENDGNGNAVISYRSSTIYLDGVDAQDLTADDFIF